MSDIATLGGVISTPDDATKTQMAALTRLTQQQQANQFFATGEKSKNDTAYDIAKMRVG